MKIAKASPPLSTIFPATGTQVPTAFALKASSSHVIPQWPRAAAPSSSILIRRIPGSEEGRCGRILPSRFTLPRRPPPHPSYQTHRVPAARPPPALGPAGLRAAALGTRPVTAPRYPSRGSTQISARILNAYARVPPKAKCLLPKGTRNGWPKSGW